MGKMTTTDHDPEPSLKKEEPVRFSIFYASCIFIFIALILAVVVLPEPWVSVIWVLPVSIGWLVLVAILGMPISKSKGKSQTEENPQVPSSDDEDFDAFDTVW